MNIEDFNKIVDFRVKEIKTILQKKAKEYSSDTDRLHNFKVAARIKCESPEKVLWGIAMKHLVSVIDMINDVTIDLNKTPTVYKPPSEDMINEKIGDMICYLILLEALFKERID